MGDLGDRSIAVPDKCAAEKVEVWRSCRGHTRGSWGGQGYHEGRLWRVLVDCDPQHFVNEAWGCCSVTVEEKRGWFP